MNAVRLTASTGLRFGSATKFRKFSPEPRLTDPSDAAVIGMSEVKFRKFRAERRSANAHSRVGDRGARVSTGRSDEHLAG